MKKIILILISLFILVGCNKQMSAKETVENYLDKYRNKDEDVIEALDFYIADKELTDEQKELYKKVLERQYNNLSYKIINESYENDESLVDVEITVYDLYQSQVESNEYLKEHETEFYDSTGVYDKEKYITYKLEKMRKYSDTITYTIEFKLHYEDNKWILEDLSNDDLEKIHGIYEND